jgi:hypothetical protein
MSLIRVVLDTHQVLSGAGVPHAFGGALAFGYHAEARGTRDADLSVFVPREEVDPVLDVLATIGIRPLAAPPERMPIAGIPMARPGDEEELDLFPSLHERYAEIEARCEAHPYGPDDTLVPFLSAQDVILFKLSFGREKDWVDLRSLAEWNPDVDVDAIADLLLDLRGQTMHPRIARFRAMVREAGEG